MGTDIGTTDVGPADTGSTPDAGMCGAGGMGCNPVTLAGCSPGQTCVATGANTYACMAPGTGGYNAACTSGVDCLESFACLGNQCRKLCCALGEHDACRTGNGGRPGALCDTRITGATYFGCTTIVRCDWFLQNCTDGGNCQPADMGGATTCEPAGTAVQNERCGSGGGVCARGYFCALASGATNPACGQICDPSLPPTADAGETADGGVSRRCPGALTCSRVTGLPTTFGVCTM